MPESLIVRLARDVAITVPQAQAAVDLLDGGATVPFIARYRKEVTQNLDDVQLRYLAERVEYLRELDDRREAVISSIKEQNKWTDDLAVAIDRAVSKQELEDIYAPYKQKRRTKAQIAREAGLQPLADALYADPTLTPLVEAAKYVLTAPPAEGAAPIFTDAQACLDGARDILSESWAEDATLVGRLREWLWTNGLFESKLVEGKDKEGEKFLDYFDYSEPIGRVPSHRALAVFRGWLAEILTVKLAQPEPEVISSPFKGEVGRGMVVGVIDEKTIPTPALPLKGRGQTPGSVFTPAESAVALQVKWSHQGRAADDWLKRVVGWTWKVKLAPSLERDLFAKLRESAEEVAIKVFGDNVRDLMLAAPAGNKVTMGLDPGIRTGVKVAVVDATGKVVDFTTVYPHEPRKDWDGSLNTLRKLAEKHGVQLIAIGNGTASRETDQLAADLIKLVHGSTGSPRTDMVKVIVSEAGASVYSASEYASQELPDLDVSIRGAVSIARRLQDPLAELVKIDPKSIGVGQYQHDVNQSLLAKKLDAIVEDCVNSVGVDVNLASAPLLTRVAGLSANNAKSIVTHREAQGAFTSRDAIKKVSGIGPKTFEQCAGFLRIRGGENPLDASSVHPESYALVEKILERAKKTLPELLGNPAALKTVSSAAFVAEGFGEITVKDVISELEKPGRDPRPEFKVAKFNDGVNDIKDLVEGMILEGTVTNVAAFGAFVDVGAHQDGLVHVSQLANKFVKDPKEVVKAGQIVKVKVVEVDVIRKRIALTMRMDAEVVKRDPNDRNQPRGGQAPRNFTPRAPEQAKPQGAMANAFAGLAGFKK
ncbi:MAG: RNA-binding transcriptional accessory protein [Betaproteobacteria bacterium]|nr:MAG: RNA-binding transcriptional accessory protein [Betaproteobacteria bacterium]